MEPAWIRKLPSYRSTYVAIQEAFRRASVIFLDSERCKGHSSCLGFTYRGYASKMQQQKRMGISIGETEDLATRLRHTRQALGAKQREFAMGANLKSNRYAQ